MREGREGNSTSKKKLKEIAILPPTSLFVSLRFKIKTFLDSLSYCAHQKDKGNITNLPNFQLQLTTSLGRKDILAIGYFVWVAIIYVYLLSPGCISFLSLSLIINSRP